MGQVIGVHANAVPTDETWPEGQEIPLGACGLQHGFGIDAHLVEDDCQLVNEGNVQVALRVLDHLGGLGHADAFRLVGACGDDAGIELIDFFGDLGCGARRHLEDIGQAVLLVAGVDPLG